MNYTKLYLLLFLIITISCQNSKETEIVKDDIFDVFDNGILGNINGAIELEITAYFDECGEWGGHQEKFRIYRINNKNLFVDFLLDTVDCHLSYPHPPKFIKLKTIELTEKEEKLIVSNLNILLKSSLENLDFGYGRHYQAVVYSTIFSDTTMLIQTGEMLRSHYGDAFYNLKSKLNINTEKGRINPS